jgi:hypothetical protein
MDIEGKMKDVPLVFNAAVLLETLISNDPENTASRLHGLASRMISECYQMIEKAKEESQGH